MALFPATEQELITAGYVLDVRDALCSSCHARVRWCTTPAKRKMPLTVVKPALTENTEGEPETILYQTHFADCPQGVAWSKKRTTR